MAGRFLNEESQKELRVQRAKWQTVAKIIAAVVIAAVLLLNLFSWQIQVVRYKGNGMEPNLHSGQTLVILKTQNVEPGDIIAFYYNNQILVRRVICAGGSQISIGNDGAVTIDGEALEEPYLNSASMGQCNLTFPYYVQPGHVFVMGDDRVIAMDSRLSEIGAIPTDRIIGKVIIAL